MKLQKNALFSLNILGKDLIMNDEELDAPTITILFQNKIININRKYKINPVTDYTENHNNKIYMSFHVSKAVHDELLKSAETLAKKYEKNTVPGRGTCIADVPFDENKNTKLIKFVLSKL
jgi:hypothetical protein